MPPLKNTDMEDDSTSLYTCDLCPDLTLKGLSDVREHFASVHISKKAKGSQDTNPQDGEENTDETPDLPTNAGQGEDNDQPLDLSMGKTARQDSSDERWR